MNDIRLITEKEFCNNEKEIRLVTLRNANGLAAQFTNYGARWVSMWAPDNSGSFKDIVLGFDHVEKYRSANEKYHGAIVGRVCGRISNASFSLSGRTYRLNANDVYGKPHPNHLHGGITAFHNSVWRTEEFINRSGEESVLFAYISKDGEEGYPGNLITKVRYTLRNDNTLEMVCEAETDNTTLVNLTNHAFFNLSGGENPDAAHQLLQVNSCEIVECDAELIPTGKLINIENTSYDFRRLRSISDSIKKGDKQVQADKGFSTAFVLSKKDNGDLVYASALYDAESGRKMDIYTDQPSLQVYTAYFMDGSDVGKNNVKYYQSAGIALEAQGFPDAINRPEFPSIILNPGQTYRHAAEYRFGVQ